MQVIKKLLLCLSGAINSLSVPIISEKMVTIWEKHIKCLQDSPGVPLHTVTGHIKKGGVELLVLKCATGIISYEAFNLHMANYIVFTTITDVIIILQDVSSKTTIDVSVNFIYKTLIMAFSIAA